MNAIIASTDFSPSATHAVHYAAALAQSVGARLVLFHHFTYPVPATDLPILQPLVYVDEMTAGYEHRLGEIKTELTRQYEGLVIDLAVRSLLLQEDLEELVQAEKADLVVMGAKGHSPVANALFGSVASKAVRRGKLPLLLVPAACAFQPYKKILFPCDNHFFPNVQVVEALKSIAAAFDAYIEVLTLKQGAEMEALATAPTPEKPHKSNLSLLLGKIKHGFSYEYRESIESGILDEAMRSHADLVAMVPHHHSLLSGLLNTSETQRLATIIKVPLLVLGERVPIAEEETVAIDAAL